MNSLQTFEFYTNLGYKVIPLHYSTKIPIFKSWNKFHNKNKLREFFITNPAEFNFGILLGEIIDVEGDSDEANTYLDHIFKDIPHPVYSSSKSKHHIFRNRNKKITRTSYKNIEYRAFMHQSVIPPSVHEDGTKYEWITEISAVKDIAFLPQNLENQLRKCVFKKTNIVKPDYLEIVCNQCKRKTYIHKKRFSAEIEVLKTLKMKWSCNKCRTIDLRPLVKKLKIN